MNKGGAALVLGLILFLSVSYVVGQGNTVRHTEIRQTVTTTTMDGDTSSHTSVKVDSWLKAPYHFEQTVIVGGKSYRTVTDQVLIREWYGPIFSFLPFNPPTKKSDQ